MTKQTRGSSTSAARTAPLGGRQVTRRNVLRAAGGGFGLWFVGTVGGRAVAIEAERVLPQDAASPTLEPSGIPKYLTALLVPPVMPRAGTVRIRGGKNADHYEISVRQFQQQILPSPLPATTVWGYGALARDWERGLLIHNAPSLTIEADWQRPVRVTWTNDLVDDEGRFLQHLLPVDPTLHWANPSGGEAGRDSRPAFESTPGRYTGPVPMVTHVHGAVGVGDESDGYAEAWYLPDAVDIPDGYATEGTWYDFFASKANARFGAAWGPGSATCQYPNDQRAATLWYHDHTLGMTRNNVYAGPAGFYLIRGGPDGDDAVLDTRTGARAVLPGPAPKANDAFPSNKTYYEIPLAIQDRSFGADGSLFYPDSREFFDGISGPFVPETDVSPIWNPEFFGNAMMVNGATWPFHTVEQRRYRFRLLNGCNSRFLILDFRDIPGVEVWQIGSDGGFLAAPVDVTTAGNTLLLGPAERADVVVDFTGVPVGEWVLGNIGPDEPFGGGVPGVDFEVANPGGTGQVMQFRVIPAAAADPTTPPAFLALPALAPLPAPTRTRPLLLAEMMSMHFDDAPAAAMLGTIDPTTREGTPLEWLHAVTENPQPGDVEVWEFHNTTADAHPMHVHEVAFQLVDRQKLMVTDDDDGPHPVVVDAGSQPMAPEPGELGWKDTVIAYPGEVTRVRMRFTSAGQYVWHCHIVEHEDNEMMRPYRIGPVQPGQPEPPSH
ncbi:multicopper oxidase [Tessaracoccus sp. OS52]|uniref:multicopper oxidase family protein n=1 Tax=Tessaracoccus sp. OS52 TaxID=2886691 RepID=UPI001D10605B|nr:multicopper oxidase [Tessaracoccus sp. OS52]MCC2592095.1 multicopper oxidase [Tessaracoccus sp. OS52]